MSGTSMNNLFNYSRALPEPFDKLSSKKVKVSSKYGSSTEATLCSTVIKAVHAMIDCMTVSGDGAVGIIDHRIIGVCSNFPNSERVSREQCREQKCFRDAKNIFIMLKSV